MNQKFLELPDTKRQAILDAAIQVFSKQPYKLANTNDIAAEAGISKGLLFHYFDTKLALYFYTLEYSVSLVNEHMTVPDSGNETDFFSILVGAMRRKMSVLARHPHIYDFLMQYSQEKDEAVRSEARLRKPALVIGENTFEQLQKADLSRFRLGVDIQTVSNLVIWVGLGFMQTKVQEDAKDLDSMMEGYIKTLELLRKLLYAEEELQ